MSYIGTRKSLWPRVTNIYAHEIVEAAFNSLPPTDGPKQMEDWAVREEYRSWLKQKLRESQLAKLLPAGLDLLPDFHETLPNWYRPISRMYRPRSYAALVEHVINHLDWYVDQHRPIRLPYMRMALVGLAMLLLPPALLIGGPLVMCLPLLLGLAFVSHVVQPMPVGYRDVNAEEFYLYVREAYSDPIEEV